VKRGFIATLDQSGESTPGALRQYGIPDSARDYRNPRSTEIKGHIETLLTVGRFDASMLLHEDYEGVSLH
jgi:fructose-bisphosphate aldolase class 1